MKTVLPSRRELTFALPKWSQNGVFFGMPVRSSSGGVPREAVGLLLASWGAQGLPKGPCLK